MAALPLAAQNHQRIAVACSGGSDSMALACLTKEWCEARGRDCIALIVDHGLRPESGTEALRVSRWLTRHGLASVILKWEGAKPRTDIQARAREARYRLMLGACRSRQIGCLLLGHHREDQAETFLLRLARGSGVDGLAAMALVRIDGGIHIARPLLDLGPDRLRATLLAHGQKKWIKDPSNTDTKYTRVRLRRLIADLDREGLSANQLAHIGAIMRRASEGLGWATDRLLAEAATLYAAGYALIDPSIFFEAPMEIQLRALKQLLQAVGGETLWLRGESLERLLHFMSDGKLGGGKTIAGCRVAPWRGLVAISRDWGRRASPVLELTHGSRDDALWDGRYGIRISAKGAAPAGLRVGALGTGARRALPKKAAELLLQLPPVARPVLPAFWGVDGLYAVPHLKYWAGGRHDVRLRFQPPGWFGAISENFR